MGRRRSVRQLRAARRLDEELAAKCRGPSPSLGIKDIIDVASFADCLRITALGQQVASDDAPLVAAPRHLKAL